MDNLVLQRAKTAVLARDFALGARLYKTLLKAEPDNMEILQALGGIYVKSGEVEKAIPYFENILACDAHNIDAMNNLGAIYRRMKNYEKSVEILQRALEEDERTAEINYTLGFTYKEMGNYDDAIECFENVTTENPNDVLAYNHLGVIYAQKKNHSKAINTYKRGLQIDPNHPIIQYNMAHSMEAIKDYTTAAKCYEFALKSKPGWADAAIDYATLLGKCHKTLQALPILKKAAAISPNNESVLKLLGSYYLKQYDWPNAETTFIKLYHIVHDDDVTLSGLGEALEKNGKAGMAVNEIKKVFNGHIQDEHLKMQYAHVLLSANCIDDAKTIIDGLLESLPDEPRTLDLLSQYYICTGDNSKAEEQFTKIKEINPQYVHHFLDGARRSLQKGDSETALSYLDQYMSVRDHNGAAWNLRGEIFTSQQKYAEAVQAYEMALMVSEVNRAAEAALKKLENREPELVKDVIAKQNENVSDEDADTLLELVEEESDEFDFGQLGVPEVEVNLDELKKNENTSFEDVVRNVDNVTDKEVPVENSEFTIDDLEEVEELEEEPVEEVPPLKISSEPITVENMPETFAPPPAPEPAPKPQAPEPEPEPETETPETTKAAMEAAERAEEMAKSVAETQEKILEAVEKIANDRLSDMVNEPFTKLSPLERSINPDFHYAEKEMPVEAIFDEPDFDSSLDTKDPFDAFDSFDAAAPDFSSIPSQPIENVETVTQNLKAANALKNAKNFLPGIVKMLEDKDKAERFHSEIDLFQKLRGLSEYLTPEDKKRFNSSRTRLLMDFLLAKMSGAPGLLKTMTGLIQSGALGADVDCNVMEKAVSDLTGDALIKKVLCDMKKMTNNLADRDLAKALKDAADEALDQL